MKMKRNLFLVILIIISLLSISGIVFIKINTEKNALMTNSLKIANLKATNMESEVSLEANLNIINATQAVKDVANAFFYRGSALQYDDYSMTYQVSSDKKRKSAYTFRPEEATIQDIKYHVCSEFVCNVYYEAFIDDEGNHYKLKSNNEVIWSTGNMISLVNSSSKYYKSNIAVDYISAERGEIASNTEEYKERILDEILPGDIIVYRRTYENGSTAGHAMLYLGDGKVLHSTGSSYSYSKKKDNLETQGTVLELDLEKDVLVNKSGMPLYTNVTQIGIIRPLNEIIEDGYKISEETLNRMKHNELVRMKTASVGKYDNVNIGDEITYTIILENKSNTEDYKNIEVTDIIPENTEFIAITGNGINTNGNLLWNIDVSHGETVEVSYTVKVKNDKALLGKSVINNNTIADGITLNSIETFINKSLTQEDKENIKKIESREGEEFNTTEELINMVYSDFTFASTEKMLSMFFSTKTINIDELVSSNYNAARQAGDEGEKEVYILKNDNSFSDENKTFANMYVKGLFGGIYTITENEPTNDDGRNKNYDDSTFTVGDLLIVYDDDFETDSYVAGEKNMYLYIDTNKFATVTNKKLTIIKSEEATSLIDSLMSQNCFIVLRPGNSMTASEIIVEESPVEKIEITTPPNKTSYIEGQDFNSAGMVVTATRKNKKEEEITGYEILNGENLQVGQTEVTIKYEEKTVTQSITVEANGITKIEITTPPTKTEYYEEESFDTTGMIVQATDKIGNTERIDSYKIENGDNLQLGQTEVIIKYEGKKATQKITVKENGIQCIKIVKEPNKTKYIAGQNFNSEGMVVKAVYKNNEEEEITDYEIIDGKDLKNGQTEVTIKYEGKTVTQKITVEANTITKIEITTPPTKTEYLEGENFDPTGMEVTATYKLGTKVITDYTIQNGESLKLGQNTVTISFEDKETSQPITVKEKQITSIKVQENPSKITYIQNEEELDLTGGTILVTYYDNTKEVIKMTSEEVEVKGFTNKEVGEVTITVTYKGSTTEFKVNVIARDNTEQDIEADGKDETILPEILPRTGVGMGIIIFIIAIAIIGIIQYVKYDRINKRMK